MNKKYYEVEILQQSYVFDNEEDAEDFYFELKSLKKGFNVTMFKSNEEGEEL